MRRGFGRPQARLRAFTLSLGIAVAAIAAVWLGATDSQASGGDRTLSIYNIHTKETVTATFKRDGRYVDAGVEQLDRQFRDWRVDEVIEIDRGLYDLLWELHTELGSEEPVHLISGHRSQRTNNMLRRTRGGQAKRSLHIKGRAADVYFPDVPLKRLRNAALVRQQGGVGYYPKSGQPFVHVDTGRVRHWPRIPEAQLAQIMKGRATVPDLPARAVREVQIASNDSVSAIAPPRAKPQSAGRQVAAEPVRLASAIFPSGSSIELPTSRPANQAGDRARVVRSWGQSWLMPSRPAAPTPSGTPGLDRAGSPRIVVASAESPSLKSDAPPITGVYAAGYAAAPIDAHGDRVAGLLAGGGRNLAAIIAEADRFQGQTSAQPAGNAGGPIDLRPAVLNAPSRPARAAPRELLAPPVMTASLGHAARDAHAPLRRTDAVAAPVGVSQLVRLPALHTDRALLAGLLSAPATDHQVTFASAEAQLAAVGSFTIADVRAFASTHRAASMPGEGFVEDMIGAARRVISWIFGN